jgi:hypothetical protein
MLPFVPEISSGIHSLPCFGKLACHPTLAPSFVLFLISAECWQILWEVCLLPHSLSQPLFLSQTLLIASDSSKVGLLPHPRSQPFLLYTHITKSSAPCPTLVLQGKFSVLPSPMLSVLDYSSLLMFFSFVRGG